MDSVLSSSTFTTLLIIFGPKIYRYVTDFYRRTRSTTPPRPLPTTAALLQGLLFVSSIVAIISTLPQFGPENVYKLTNSRLTQTSSNVLFNRLENIRPLTAADELLKERLRPREGRLLYAAYGPNPMKYCTWCETGTDYLWYLLPSVAVPHLLHLVVLGAATSSSILDNPDGGYFRTYATLMGTALAAVEVWAFMSYDVKKNAISLGQRDVQWFYWDVLFYRGVAISIMDVLLGWFIYLSATRRIDLGIDSNLTKNITEAAMLLKHIDVKISSAKVVRDATMNNSYLRVKTQAFWDKEKQERKKTLQGSDAQVWREEILESAEGKAMEENAKQQAKHLADACRERVRMTQNLMNMRADGAQD